jgi:hypothetical protein
MSRIPEKAQKAAELAWKAGHVTVLWTNLKDNTGAVRVYQRVRSAGGQHGKLTRVTGRTIAKLLAEIDDAVAKGELS